MGGLSAHLTDGRVQNRVSGARRTDLDGLAGLLRCVRAALDTTLRRPGGHTTVRNCPLNAPADSGHTGVAPR